MARGGKGALAAAALLGLVQGAAAQSPAQLDWNPRAAEICLFPGAATPRTPAQSQAAALLARLPAGSPYAGLLDEADVALCIDARPSDARGYFAPDNGVLVLAAGQTEDRMLAILLHELRHVDQSLRGYCPRTDLSMKENARAVLAMEADAQAVATLLAWDLRELGDTGPWSALLAMPETAGIASAFERTIAAGGDIADATSAAFDTWYDAEERRERYYLAACSDYLERLDAAHLPPSYQLLPETYLPELCRLPDGTAYDCTER